MKYFKLIKFLIISLSINVYAEEIIDDNRKINPRWLEYTSLSEEEKKAYEAIPEQYIYDYVPKNKPSILNNYNANYFSLDGTNTLPDYYTNTKRNE